jgi:hypothetical protein
MLSFMLLKDISQEELCIHKEIYANSLALKIYTAVTRSGY